MTKKYTKRIDTDKVCAIIGLLIATMAIVGTIYCNIVGPIAVVENGQIVEFLGKGF